MDTTESRSFAARLADLLAHEHHAMADFLVALAEFDRRRGWLTLGYANFFDFLVRELGLARGTAHYRKTAAYLVQRYPEVLDALRQGTLCMSSIVELARVITPENRAEVLPRFLHCSKQEAKAISAELAPRKVVPHRDVVTTIRTAPAAEALSFLQAPVEAPERPPGTPCRPVQPVELGDRAPMDDGFQLRPPPPRRLEIEPLTATESRLHITVSRPFLKKLEAARLALSHAMPGADAEAILSAGLDLLLARDAKRKGLVEKSRSAPVDAPETPGAVYIPRAVRREVWERDQGRCQYPLDSGGICGSKLRLEADHLQLRCRGGRPTVENLRVVCRFHNELSARQELGDAVMNRYTRDPKLPLLDRLLGDSSGG